MKEFKNRKIAHKLFVITLFIASIFSFIAFINEYKKCSLIEKNAYLTFGVVTKINQNYFGGQKSYWFELKYNYKDSLLNGKIEGLYSYDEFKINQKVEMLISNNDPSKYVLVKNMNYWNRLWVSIVCLFLMILLIKFKSKII
ncbi:MAG: hypothetical protein KBC58_09470 [Flavobacterium sp.]|jgi:hypothetical protein|nr:hypothetical protein [Flavobacterium sp.]